MRRLMMALRVSLFAALAVANVSLASARDNTIWATGGTYPLSDKSIHEMDDVFLRKALEALELPEWAIEEFIAGEYTCVWRDITFGEYFSKMTYEDFAVLENIIAKLKPGSDVRAERCTVVNDDTGERIEVTDPQICHNLARSEPPPEYGPCYEINFNYQENTQVVMQTGKQIKKRHGWDFSKAQYMLHSDQKFALVLVHLRVSRTELKRIMAHSECFGYEDSTGFHREIDLSCEFCVEGEYPPPEFIRRYNRKHGTKLPEKEPGYAFLIPLADGKGRLVLPREDADTDVLPCVLVDLYNVILEGYQEYKSMFHFDYVYAWQGARSLAIGEERLAPDQDIPLLEDEPSSETRYLEGELKF